MMNVYFLGLLASLLANIVLANEPISSGATVLTYNTAGNVLDYEWAHRQHRLAVLVENPPQLDKLIVFEVKPNSEPIIHTFKPAQHPNCLAWLKDDSGFLLAISANTQDETASIDELYRYTFNEPREQPVYANIERQFANIFAIDVDADSDYWALGSGGEGVTDVSIYQNEHLILSTDVFPGSISSVSWQQQRLLVLSDAYLEYGLSNKERQQYTQVNKVIASGRDWGDVRLYAVDAKTRAAKLDNRTPDELDTLTHASFDKRYTIEISQDPNQVTVKIQRQ
ncbi:hypothetical protein [Methylocucumis oryzae]|nr:hypothetical protein [Methylocucumis oryzae]